MRRFQFDSIEQTSEVQEALGLDTGEITIGAHHREMLSPSSSFLLGNSSQGIAMSDGLGPRDEIFPRQEDYVPLDTAIKNWTNVVHMIYPEEFSSPKKTFQAVKDLPLVPTGHDRKYFPLEFDSESSGEEEDIEEGTDTMSVAIQKQPKLRNHQHTFSQDKDMFFQLLNDGLREGDKSIHLNAVAVKLASETDGEQYSEQEFVLGSSKDKGKGRMEGERPHPENFEIKIEKQDTVIPPLRSKDNKVPSKRSRENKGSGKHSRKKMSQSKNKYQRQFSRAPSEMPTGIHFSSFDDKSESSPPSDNSSSSSSSSSTSSSTPGRKTHRDRTPLDSTAGGAGSGRNGGDSPPSSSSSSSESSSDSESEDNKSRKKKRSPSQERRQKD
ncbi:hypothetical protein M422DRAFT_46258 [Sphaerobolus stellatus SS14]|uniref:Uncharacterized protein n=1 Tax=Sphaerobolus stellatus (strain SS14) TaxID=990650 RepID=A0A0C9UTS1_SPHS4|nr:hypothetical protein M422DRAFT_46258 [Sphaerobolus stellatus SS14]